MEEKTTSKTGLFIVLAIVAALTIGAFIFFNNKNSPSLPIATPAPSTAPLKSFSLEEISKHSVKSDCWMAIEGNVYDVTSFVPKHPGEDAILQGCGKDATSMFNSRPNDGTSHSNRARQTLSGLEIGVLAQ